MTIWDNLSQEWKAALICQQTKGQNHISISVDVEKAFDRIQYSFKIKKKTLPQIRTRRELENLLNLTNGICEAPTATILLMERG